MAIGISCEDCDWAAEMQSSEMPLRCPECGGRIENEREFGEIPDKERKSFTKG